MTRLACFFVPMFPLAARLRSEPELRDSALAIVEGNGHHARIVAATRKARKEGIRPGLSVPQARAIMPKLVTRSRDAACEHTAQEALLEVAETFSPRIEDAGGGVVFLDVSGMERHFASEGELGKAAMRAADGLGLPIRVGLASSKLAARVAAELPQSPTVVAPGDEASFLAPLPLTRLAPELEVAATLDQWGIATIGDLARLAEREVATRLGTIGRSLHTAARGVDPTPLIPRAVPPEFREGMESEWAMTELEQFLFVARAALERLSTRLELQGFACTKLELTLTLDPEGYLARSIDLPAPTRDVKTLLTLIRLDLEKTPPGAPVTGFTIVAHPDRPRRAQLSLFGPAALSPEKLATTIARLISMLGEDRVGVPMTVDGHLPERYAIGPFDPPAPPEMRSGSKTKRRPFVAMRIFRPPIPAEVITQPAREDDNRIEIASIRAEEISGTVRSSCGPWPVEEGWWRQSPHKREYWDIEMMEGEIYRMYRDEVGQGWYVDGQGVA